MSSQTVISNIIFYVYMFISGGLPTSQPQLLLVLCQHYHYDTCYLDESQLMFLIFIQDVPALSLKETKTTDGAFRLELKAPPKKHMKENSWNFLDKYGFHYGGASHCRALLPQEVIISYWSIFKVLVNVSKVKYLQMIMLMLPHGICCEQPKKQYFKIMLMLVDV